MAFTLVDLPFPKDALGDTISSKTFELHHDKHHQTYIDKTNDLAAKAGLEGRKLSEIVREARERKEQPLFNNAAQAWNHNFFWQCLSPNAQRPSGKLAAMIEDSFGSTDDMLARFKEEATGHFASGWAWLVLKGDQIEVTSFHDADSPVAHDDVKPLFGLDVWEHAYYLDYLNARPAYVDAVMSKAVNWDFVARNLDGGGVGRADQDG